MGSGQSSQGAVGSEQVISAPEPSTSVEFSPSLISRLSHPHESSSSGNSTDDIVRRRLAAESAHLRSQEAEILEKISAALEKENLEKDKASGGLNSNVLGRDIEEVREKVERLSEKRYNESAAVRGARDQVTKCYLNNPDRSLDCWKQVEAFKSEVSKLEQAFVKSLQ